MRAIGIPQHNAQHVYQTCIRGVSDAHLRNRLDGIAQEVLLAGEEYGQKSVRKKLFSIPQNVCRNDEIVVGAVTKGELKDVYGNHMVKENKPARVIYDELRALAPLGVCPYCGFGHVSTLDHYLPTSKYPLLSVLPINLIPSCGDCNKGKLAGVAISEDEQFLHPYFDHEHFVRDQWLFAEVEETQPVNISYFVRPPDDWDTVSQNRVKAHFRDFKLAHRFSKQASTEVIPLGDILTSYLGASGIAGVRQYLDIASQAYSHDHLNSWEAAMFQALAENDWYCSGGFIF